MAEKRSVFVLGGGTAGQAAARYLARKGWDVTVAENDRLGGTCAWRGCIPKKSLYTSARSLREARRSETFGVTCGSLDFDWQGVLAWKWHAQETFADDQEGIAERAGIKVVRDTVRFVSPDEVEVAGVRYAADQFIIATGSEPVVPDKLLGRELADTSDDALRWPELPRTLLIVGGGFVAMEFAGIFASFGVKTTVLTHAKRILDMLDADLASVAVQHLEAMGVEFVSEARLGSLAGGRGNLKATVVGPSGAERVLEPDRVLLAVGRRPAIAELDLDAAGIGVSDRGEVEHDEFLRSANPKVWVCGDTAGGMMQTPVANMEGRMVAESIDSGTPVAPEYAAMPVTCFTVPQLASVGLTEEQAAAQNRRIGVHRTTFEFIGAAIVEDERSGFAKLIVDANDETLLGAQMAGPTASDCIYAPALAIKAGMSAADIAECPAVHPSFAEAIYYAGW